MKRLLCDQWPVRRRRQVKARRVLSSAGKMWNLACVVRAGRHFVCSRLLLRLTGLHDSSGRKTQIQTVEFGRKFHAGPPLLEVGDKPRATEGRLAPPGTRR